MQAILIVTVANKIPNHQDCNSRAQDDKQSSP